MILKTKISLPRALKQCWSFYLCLWRIARKQQDNALNVVWGLSFNLCIQKLPKKWNLISWILSIDQLIIIRFFFFLFKSESKCRCEFWVGNLWTAWQLLAGVPGWTMDLTRFLTMPEAAHGLCYQLLLCPCIQPPGDGHHGWGHGQCQGHLWFWLTHPVGAAAAAWQTWGRSSGMVHQWSALVSIPVSVDDPSRWVISSLVRWAPPKEQRGLKGWILRNPKNQALVLMATCGWCTHNTAFLVTLKKGWSVSFCTQMDY